MRIYIESTIPSYVVARPARDLLPPARQQLTRDWWEFKRSGHELFISQLVLDEIAFGEPAMAKRRLELVAEIALLASTDEARKLPKHHGFAAAACEGRGRRSAYRTGDRS